MCREKMYIKNIWIKAIKCDIYGCYMYVIRI